MELMIDAAKVKQLRKLRSWTQEHLAEVSEVSLRTIQRIEKDGACSPESLQALAAVFEISASELQVDEVEKKRNRFFRRVLLVSYFGNTLGLLSAFAGITYGVISGDLSGREAGQYYGGIALFGGFLYIFVALMVEYMRKHDLGRWQTDV